MKSETVLEANATVVLLAKPPPEIVIVPEYGELVATTVLAKRMYILCFDALLAMVALPDVPVGVNGIELVNVPDEVVDISKPVGAVTVTVAVVSPVP